MQKRLFLFILLAVPALCWAGDNDDFGTWFEVGAEKSLPKNLSVGLEGELRTDDNSTQVDRVAVGASIGYKVNKYFKLGASYSFMDSFSPEKTKEKTNGYNITESYWTPKHRLNLEATANMKFFKWLRISVRERYQMTKIMDVDGVMKERWRNGILMGTEEDPKPGHTTQYIRSRIKFEVDKKHLAWSPFVSIEFHDNLRNQFHLDKLRTTVGTEYKINKHHSVSAAYVLTNEFDETPYERMHALNIGYNYKF